MRSVILPLLLEGPFIEAREFLRRAAGSGLLPLLLEGPFIEARAGCGMRIA